MASGMALGGLLDIVQIDAWTAYPWLRHGFSTRAGGRSTVYAGGTGERELNLGRNGQDLPEAVAENRALFLAGVGGAQPFGLATVRQVHGAEVVLLDHAPQTPIEADGMVTAAPGLLLGILTADCVPVLIADTRRRVVAALHAGWRGTAAAIVSHGIAALEERFGSAPADLVAAIGPLIGPCCYQVGEALESHFSPDLFTRTPDGLHLDLWHANRDQLLAAGIPAARITLVGECTACTRSGERPRYFSHRAEAGFTGRSMGAIGIGPG